MRRVIPIVASLYPRPWRARYGDEFTALLEDLGPNPSAALNVFTGAIAMQIRTWSYASIFVISGAIACAVFATVLHTTPRSYVSQGILAVRGTDSAEDKADEVLRFAQQVESRQSLTAIVDTESLYPSERSQKPALDPLERMKRDISIEPLGSFAAIKIGFRYPDAATAQRVTDKLLETFLDKSNGSATSLKVLDAASLPAQAVLNAPLIAATAAVPAGLLILGLLSFFRRRALRKA